MPQNIVVHYLQQNLKVFDFSTYLLVFHMKDVQTCNVNLIYIWDGANQCWFGQVCFSRTIKAKFRIFFHCGWYINLKEYFHLN